MKMLTTLAIAAVLGVAVPFAASAQDDALPAGFATKLVIDTGTTRDGEPIVYPTGTPKMTAVIGTLEPEGRTALHQHPVPVFVYVLEGEAELQTEGGEPQRYAAGESWIESQNRMHQASNVADTPTRLLVVFMGEEGQPTTVAAE